MISERHWGGSAFPQVPQAQPAAEHRGGKCCSHRKPFSQQDGNHRAVSVCAVSAKVASPLCTGSLPNSTLHAPHKYHSPCNSCCCLTLPHRCRVTLLGVLSVSPLEESFPHMPGPWHIISRRSTAFSNRPTSLSISTAVHNLHRQNTIILINSQTLERVYQLSGTSSTSTRRIISTWLCTLMMGRRVLHISRDIKITQQPLSIATVTP